MNEKSYLQVEVLPPLRKKNLFQTLFHDFFLFKPCMYGLYKCLNVIETISFLAFFFFLLKFSNLLFKSPRTFMLFQKVHSVSKVPRVDLERTLNMTLTKKERFQIFYKCLLYYLYHNTAGENYCRNRVRTGSTECDLRLIVQQFMQAVSSKPG